MKKYIMYIIMCSFLVPLQAMESVPSQLHKSVRMPEQLQRSKSDLVWIKTSDGQIIGIPRWQVEQMQTLQVFLVHQKGENSKDNPIDASMVTSEQLQLLQDAFAKASDLQQLEQFIKDLSAEVKRNLINSAFILEAQGLASLFIKIIFPKELQGQMGASVIQPASMMIPVVTYLNKSAIKVFEMHAEQFITCIAYSPDGNYMVSGSEDGNLIIWDAKTGEQIKVIKAFSQGISCVAYNQNGNYIAAGSEKQLIIWDVKTGKQIRALKGSAQNITCVAYRPDSDYIIAGSDTQLTLWNAKTGNRIKLPLKTNTGPMICVAYSPDGNTILTGSSNGKLILWGADAGNKIQVHAMSNKSKVCIAFSPDGKYIVSGAGRQLIIWDGHLKEQIKILEADDVVSCIAYDPDGKHIVSGSENGNLIIWTIETGEQIKRFKGTSQTISCIAYSQDGNYIVSGSHDTLILWKLFKPDFIETKLNMAQARLLYRLYLAKINDVSVILDKADLDYQIYLTLPDEVQDFIKQYLPFEKASKGF